MNQLYTVAEGSPVWYQKYRPQKIEECVFVPEVQTLLQSMVQSKNAGSLLFVGGPGTGKTTASMALANELGASTMVINASLDANLDLIRTSISQFASTVSLMNNDRLKIVILDELDSAPPSFQPALRSFMETFSNNVSFFITANYKNKIIDPIKSRCQVVEFSIPAEAKPKLASQYFRRVCKILDLENIQYDKACVAELVSKKFPDFRAILNTLQMYAASGVIDTGVLSKQFESCFEPLIGFLKENNFTDMRKWLANNQSIDSADLCRYLFDKANTFLVPSAVPEMVLILGKYQYQAAFVADKEINDCAMLTEIMVTCEKL